MTLKTTPFDPADYLDTEEDIVAYLDASMEGGDPKHIARAGRRCALEGHD